MPVVPSAPWGPTVSRPPCRRWSVIVRWAAACGAAAVSLWPAAPVHAESRGGGGITIEPLLSITGVARHRSGAGGDEGSEAVVTLTPGVRITSRVGRLQGSVDYRLSAGAYLSGEEDSTLQQRLGARVRAELIENHLDLNLTGNVSRQPTSVFGLQSADGTLTEDNHSEVRDFSVQPVLRGVLGGVVAVQASATARYGNADTRGFGNEGQAAQLTLSSAQPAKVGWSLSGTRQIADYEAGRKTTSDRVQAMVSVRPDVDWAFSLRAGQERTDIASVQGRTYDNWGAGVAWTPTPRTRLTVDADRRFFGDTYALSAQHRHRRAVWSYSGSRALNEGTGEGIIAVRAYDLFFDLFASQEPDPVARDALVRSYLDRNGIPPEAIIGGLGFLTRAASVQERHQLSLALSWRRTSLTGSVYMSRSERVDTVSGAIDDLSEGSVRQQGLSLAVSHRLTLRDSVGLSTSMAGTRSSGDRFGSDLYSLSLTWSKRVSDRTSFSLGLRRSTYDSEEPGADYDETALTTALNLRFF